MRLVGGSLSAGRVEICTFGVWGTLCDNGWKNTSAEVVCRRLGLPYRGEHSTDACLNSMSLVLPPNTCMQMLLYENSTLISLLHI